MSGILEQIMAKMDDHIAGMAKLVDALAEHKAANGGSATAEKTSTGRGRKAAETKADDGPKTTEAALVAKFDELKGTDPEKRMPALKKIIADLGFTSLKELRVTPAKFDEAMDKLTAYEAELAAAPADDEDDL